MAHNNSTSFILKLKKLALFNSKSGFRNFSIQAQKLQKDKYKLLVIGGGAGGEILKI